MNRLFMLLIITTSYSCQAQQPAGNASQPIAAADTIEAFNGEFNVYQNGLIYSPYTVQQLTHIVDSLNLKFKRCDLNKSFLSARQGMGYHVQVSKKKARQAAKDMAAGMSLEAVVKKYNGDRRPDSFLVFIEEQRDYNNEIAYGFTGLTFKDYDDISIYKKGGINYLTASLANTWVADKPHDDYPLDAIYFKEEPRMTVIPEKYARMILYSECVIDTSTDIYTGTKDKSDYFGSRNPEFEDGYKQTKLFAFIDYLEKSTAHITNAQLLAGYQHSEYQGVDSMKKAFVRATLSKEAAFKTRLKEAVDEFNNGKTGTGEDVEYYVANYYSKKTALEMKRRRKVTGACSMDQSPRIHAQEIAMLSAEAVNWETFLRAHLNIMNDRFERVSDGSWAYASRQTYIKELEILNLEVNELLIGISLCVSNAAEKHYFGSISRLGRALAETSDKTTLVNTLMTAIADPQLDVYNRVLMFYLLDHYAYNLNEKSARKDAYRLLLKAKKSLPAYVGGRIKLSEKDY